MKPKRSDYLIILASLVAIFLSGAAVGYVVGQKRAHGPSSRVDGGLPDPSADWETRTLERLRAELGLDERQSEQIDSEIRATFQKIRGSREHALEDYYRSLLELHDRILPHLDENQKARLLRDRKHLQRVIEERFENP